MSNNKNLKRYNLIEKFIRVLNIIMFLSLLFFYPLVASSVTIGPVIIDTTIPGFINRIIDFILIISIPIATISIIIAGFYFITAMGNPEKINTGKKMIIWTLIGLIIILISKGLVETIIKVLNPK